MVQEMLVLVGAGLFMKVFFESAKGIKTSVTENNQRKKRVSTLIHIGLGMLFILLARFYVAM